jgi:hypothetical protein
MCHRSLVLLMFSSTVPLSAILQGGALLDVKGGLKWSCSNIEMNHHETVAVVLVMHFFS